MILKLDSNLPFVWLIPNERMFQKLLGGGPLHVILHQASFYKTKKLLGPKRESEKRSSDFYHEEQSSKIPVTYKLVHEARLQDSLSNAANARG